MWSSIVRAGRLIIASTAGTIAANLLSLEFQEDFYVSEQKIIVSTILVVFLVSYLYVILQIYLRQIIEEEKQQD